MSAGRADGKLIEVATRRPCVTIAALGIVPVVVNTLWAARNRGLDSLSIDESGMTAQAFRLHHDLLRGDVGAFVSHLLESEPVVPLLNVPPFLLGAADVNTPVTVLAVVGVFCAVAATAMTRRLAGPRIAVVAGIVALAFPQALHAPRLFGFGLGAAAGLTGAGWSLLASDRGRRLGPMIALGLATGAMVSARAMTVAFVPAVLGAAAVQIGDDRRGRRHAAIAAVVAVVVAAPYWIRKWAPMWGYLTTYGYGERSSNLGQNSPLWLGPLYRMLEWFGSFGVITTVAGIALVVSVLAPRRRQLVAWVRGPWSPWTRDVLTMLTILVGGYAALLTTVNSGHNFTLPLSYFLIVGVATVARAASPAARRRVGAACLTSIVAVLVLSLVGRMPDGGPGALPWVLVDVQGNENRAASGDPALDRRWWDANQRLTDVLMRYDRAGRRLEYLVVGDGSEEMNTGTITLATFMRDRDPPRLAGLSGNESPQMWAGRLNPGDGYETITIVVEPLDNTLGPTGVFDEFRRFVRGRGWRTVAVVDLPDGGTVTVMTPPGMEPAAR